MKTKLTTKRNDGRGYEWDILIQGYDIFETEETLVSWLNAAGCRTYLNKKGEVVAFCGPSKITAFMHKAEKLYNELFQLIKK